MLWFGWLLGVVVVLVLLDRLALAAERRGWIYWRRSGRRSGTGAAAVLGELIEAFQPSRQVTVAEEQSRRRVVQRPGAAAPPLDVDLDAGTARLATRRPS